MTRTMLGALLGLLGLLVALLIVAAVLLVRDARTTDEPAVAVEEAVAVASSATPPPPTSNATNTPLPAPEVLVLPTSTSRPTDTPTNTPEASATPEPTATPTNPPPTAVPPPVVFPTATPVPPTAVPPPVDPPPGVHNGLRATSFALQPRSVYAVGQLVWFEFTLANDSGAPVPYGGIGVIARRDQTDTQVQISWGGNDDEWPVGSKFHEDNIRINAAGNYKLRLAVCFDAYAACQNFSAPWFTLSQSIPATIN